ncbi:hypothetical protein KIW84_032077 [Lathyrus oleraceus]|uniref:Integrase catalytic domain-containing protein n=1 Tax=Pisum sativum TaxID=3888 RepID=A0A9D5B1F3_PEA|nr:hypothetical protein KIW84_032077 [Pisum sativum]
MFLAHTHVTICRSISTLDPVGNDFATVHYDFENPIYQAEDGSEEDCEVPRELARLVLQKTIQPHEESLEIVNLGTEINKREVRGFLGHSNYIARFIPHLTATCKPIFKLLKRKNQEMFKIKHHNSSPYRPKTNGAVEAANNIKKIIQKMTVTYKDWHEMLPFALHGYRTSVRTSTGATPFSLVYGTEAVLPVEVQIPSLRIMKEAGLDEDEWIQTRLDQINLIDEKRLAAVCHGQIYQKRMTQAFNKKVKRRVYQIGDLVIKRIILPQGDPRGKWTPTYEGSFVVKKVSSGGAMMLATMDGEEFPHPVNADIVKKYYA